MEEFKIFDIRIILNGIKKTVHNNEKSYYAKNIT